MHLLAPLGWTDALSVAFHPYAGTHVPGRVARADRGLFDVLTDPDAAPLRARSVPRAPDVAVGDWVAVGTDDAGAYADVVLPRQTALVRAAASGRSHAQVLAANVDIVLVVVPAFPEPRLGAVERMVALAWEGGCTPVVVVTKCDLPPDPAGVVADIAASAPGVDVLAVSAVDGTGLDELAAYAAPGRTLCLLGRSGAGKSTLVNALAGVDLMAVGDIRSDGKGRHTTTHRELVLLPGGAVLLDTPGIRGVGLALCDDGLERAFGDVEDLAAQCRFTDCGHETEPGCAVLDAVADGRLPERRLASWRKLQREAAWMARRHDARLRAEAGRQWKQISMEVRRSGRTRP